MIGPVRNRRRRKQPRGDLEEHEAQLGQITGPDQQRMRFGSFYSIREPVQELIKGIPPVVNAIPGCRRLAPTRCAPVDWLSKIAITWYHDMNKWPIIYDANRALIGSDPNKIKPGQVLTIPDLADYTPAEIAAAVKRAKGWKR